MEMALHFLSVLPLEAEVPYLCICVFTFVTFYICICLFVIQILYLDLHFLSLFPSEMGPNLYFALNNNFCFEDLVGMTDKAVFLGFFVWE